jgi:flagellin-specific chaperone FliS
MTNSIRTYRNSAAEGMTHIGLVIATYDALAEDIRMAGDAAESRNIALRCRHTSHALQLLGHLENWVPLLEEAALEENLLRFYSYVRGELLRLQLRFEKKGFAKLAMHIGEMRAAWYQKQCQGQSPQRSAVPELLSPEPAASAADSRFRWSA